MSLSLQGEIGAAAAQRLLDGGAVAVSARSTMADTPTEATLQR